ncbi:hypothetical protein IMZ48_25485 [Candidatus Bathyarchaeota archaeon]|nr:hypothetical protein [Candidatus Bathyarchaeota archaeon]
MPLQTPIPAPKAKSPRPKQQANTHAQLPLWFLVTFGAYLLFSLGWGVLTFNDVPLAHQELMGEIDLAKKDLRARGVDVDED